MREQKERKVRSDKKTHIAPYITLAERGLILEIAKHLKDHEGNVGRLLVDAALHDEICIDYFRAYFKRPFSFNEHVTIWREKKPLPINRYIAMKSSEERSRFKIKADQYLYERLTDFKISLDTMYLSHATYALLRYALTHETIIRRVAPFFKKKAHTRRLTPSNSWSVLGD